MQDLSVEPRLKVVARTEMDKLQAEVLTIETGLPKRSQNFEAFKREWERKMKVWEEDEARAKLRQEEYKKVCMYVCI